MRRIGIIDLGSNTVRLVVYEARRHVASRRPKDGELSVADAWQHGGKRPFREIMDKKKIAGLSAYVADGKLSDEGIECAIEAVKSLVKLANNIGCSDVHVFATAVIRNCKNSKRVTEEINKGANVSLDVLGEVDEAHLGFVGATCDRVIDEGTLIDIGGGSTELTAIQGGHDVRDLSIPQGSVSSYAQFVSYILPQPGEEEAIRDAFAKNLSRVKNLDGFATRAMYGIGGSVRAVARMLGRMNGRDKAQKQMAPADVDRVLALLEEDPSTFAHLAVKAVPDRLHSVVPGCILLRTLMEAAQAKMLTLCKYGVREGYLSERVLG